MEKIKNDIYNHGWQGMCKKWDNIEDLKSYVIEKNNHGYTGRLIDKDNNTISILGMSADDIGFSYNKAKTEKITYNYFVEVKEMLL